MKVSSFVKQNIIKNLKEKKVININSIMKKLEEKLFCSESVKSYETDIFYNDDSWGILKIYLESSRDITVEIGSISYSVFSYSKMRENIKE